MKRPTKLTIMGKTYRVTYAKDMVDTDIDKRSALWGQVDYHTRTIRVYIGKGKHARQPGDVFEVLLHEVLHVILTENKLIEDALKDSVKKESFIDNVAMVVADTLTRNRLVAGL